MDLNQQEAKSDKRFIALQTSVIVFGLVICTAAFTWSVSMISAKLETTPKDVLSELASIREDMQDYEEIREQSQRIQIESESILSAIDDSDAAYVMIDRHGKITHWSKGAHEFFGIDHENAIGYGIAFLIPPSERQKHQSMFEKAMDVKGAAAVRNRLIRCNCVHANGSEMPVEIKLWISPGRGALAEFRHQKDKS